MASQWMYDAPEDILAAEEEAAARPRSHSQSPDEESDDGHEYEGEWDNMRDGSISRRPAWRRPSPKWIYPFIVGATLTMGMGMAPRQELYISLACLTHPPQQPSSYDMVLAGISPDTASREFSLGKIRCRSTRPSRCSHQYRRNHRHPRRISGSSKSSGRSTSTSYLTNMSRALPRPQSRQHRMGFRLRRCPIRHLLAVRGRHRSRCLQTKKDRGRTREGNKKDPRIIRSTRSFARRIQRCKLLLRD